MKGSLLALAAVALLCTAALGQDALPASVPRLVNYQGTLVNSNGDPIVDGNYDFSCSVWDEEALGEGTLVWGPQTFSDVAVVNGNYHLVLGPFDEDAPPRPIRRAFQEVAGANPERFLEITVSHEADMLTVDRQEVLASAYALRAGNDVPPGTVIMFGGPESNVPAGWFPCDGRALSSTEYPSLFGALGTQWGTGDGGGNNFNVPDLRNQYMRGVDGGAGRDTGVGARTPAGTGQAGEPGSFQASSLRDHTHGLEDHRHSGGSLVGFFSLSASNAYSVVPRFGVSFPWTTTHELGSISYNENSGSVTTGLDIGGFTAESGTPATSGTTLDPAATTETRPISKVTLFIIKY